MQIKSAGDVLGGLHPAGSRPYYFASPACRRHPSSGSSTSVHFLVEQFVLESDLAGVVPYSFLPDWMSREWSSMVAGLPNVLSICTASAYSSSFAILLESMSTAPKLTPTENFVPRPGGPVGSLSPPTPSYASMLNVSRYCFAMVKCISA
jgi:hypothetical protein